MHIETQTERDAAVEFIGDMGACLGPCNYKTRHIYKMVVEELKAAILSYDRRQLVDCEYEPMVCYVEVVFKEGLVQQVKPLFGDPPKEGCIAQCCLVYTNTYEENASPYTGTWDGYIQDFHRDEEKEWSSYRDATFGYGHNGCEDSSGYRFFKTNLDIYAPSGEGSECLPDWFHIGYKTKTDFATWAEYWDPKEKGRLDGIFFTNVPVRLVLPRTPGAKPYTGSWDLAPWEDA